RRGSILFPYTTLFRSAVGFDLRSVIAAQEARDGLVADFAEQVPEGDVDAADGVLDGAAAALPKHSLPQPLGDAHRLVGALADEEDRKSTRLNSSYEWI